MYEDEEKVVLELLREAFSFRYSSAQALLGGSSLALELVTARRSTAPVAFELEGYCRAHVGNAQRILGQLHEAGQELNAARSLLERGTARPSFLAELYRFQASLEESTGDLVAAEKAINKAEQFYALLGDMAGRAACCVKRAIILIHADRPSEAFTTILGVVPSIESEDLLRCAYEVGVRALVEAGEYRFALHLFEMSRDLFGRGGDLFKLKVLWLEGQVTGKYSFLREARNGYAERGMIFEAALLLLEEAATAVHAGELREARTLLDEAGPALAVLGIVEDNLATVLLDLDLTKREGLERAEAILLVLLKKARLL
jgi:hypothetical protein